MLQYNRDYFVHLLPFNCKGVTEAIHPNEDGTYTILIEATLSREKQKKVLKHALSHICNDDFEKECSVDYIEKNAHDL